MSAEVLTASIEKLLKLHNSLYELTVQKTDIIKTGDMEALDQLLKEEQKHIAVIGQVEKERQKAVKEIVPNIEQPVFSDCMDVIDSTEKEKLKEMGKKLALLVTNLKEQNFLNQQLIHQSLQFVNFSLGLLRPKPSNINYGPPTKNQKPSEQYSSGIFNSEA
ncbi:flagellar protein FlgN [Cytobacillus depressus]|uniref:Flagellar protein FlgN n=1 Tax=Cytobacillus depressus TaxID=1602942 RepID=A0A6L3V6B8_9BACI|nr:flagellar protein FlgN [Cytobacillus depressus]KAB2336784.1 flagellar protein FlgN [Cytobacillus depressus]